MVPVGTIPLLSVNRFPGSGVSWCVGVFRRVQPNRAGGVVCDRAADVVHPTGRADGRGHLRLRGHRAHPQPQLLRSYHHEPRLRRTIRAS